MSRPSDHISIWLNITHEVNEAHEAQKGIYMNISDFERLTAQMQNTRQNLQKQISEKEEELEGVVKDMGAAAAAGDYEEVERCAERKVVLETVLKTLRETKITAAYSDDDVKKAIAADMAEGCEKLDQLRKEYEALREQMGQILMAYAKERNELLKKRQKYRPYVSNRKEFSTATLPVSFGFSIPEKNFFSDILEKYDIRDRNPGGMGNLFTALNGNDPVPYF